MRGFSPDLFRDRTVVVTGAGRGIGLAVAQAFAGCGARLLLHSGRAGTAERVKHLGTAFEADLTRRDEVERLSRDVTAACERIDVLVNNAGTMMGRFPADELTDADYDALVALNQSAVVGLTRNLLGPLRLGAEANGSAAIVNTVSISARTGGSPGSAIYSATKAFVATYTRALARELGPEGIRANAVSPGTIATDFHERYSSREKLDATATAVPLGRLGTAEDCAGAYLFLASDLSGYVTGQVLEINGGQLMP